MMKTTILLTTLLLLAGSTRASAAEPTFERDVLPILTAHCLACHGGVTQQNNLDLRTHATLLRGGKTGPAVMPGKPEESLLWQKIDTDEMPKTDNKVSPAGKAAIRRWIESGAKSAGLARAFRPPEMPREPGEVAQEIDRAIRLKLAEEKVPASPQADDAEFLRRVYLDITGRIPTRQAAESFLADTQADKRKRLIDELLTRREYGQHFAVSFVNAFDRISSNANRRRLNFLGEYTRWLGEGLHAGRRWDELIRKSVAYTGKIDAKNPVSAFTFLNLNVGGQFSAEIMTANFAQVLLGIQLQCAECHHHPTQNWKQTDFWGLAAFFQNLNIDGAGLGESARGKKGNAGGAVAIRIPTKGQARDGGKLVPAKFLGGEEPTLDASGPYRPAFAAWLTARDNPFFARAYANRLWAQLLGRGFVNPLNDFSEANPPSHPEVLDLLAGEFAASQYDVRHLVRCICRTEAYQRSSAALPGNQRDAALFSHQAVKSMTAEMLHDSLCVALEVPSLGSDLRNLVGDREAFIKEFREGAGSDDPIEFTFGVPHALRLLNRTSIQQGGEIVDRLLQEAPSGKLESAITAVFLATLSRRPSPQEAQRLREFIEKRKDPRDGLRLALWTILNTNEFILNH